MTYARRRNERWLRTWVAGSITGRTRLPIVLNTSQRSSALTDQFRAADLARASGALFDVSEWPTTVVGDELDAPYAAPTSGGPPFRVYEVMPARAFAFPTNDQFEPTRFTFG